MNKSTKTTTITDTIDLTDSPSITNVIDVIDLTKPSKKQKKRKPPLVQSAQKCPYCEKYLMGYEKLSIYEGDLDDFQGWMCHAECI